MLGSITPLGERSRRMRWGVTATAHVAGCGLGGLLAGTLLGLAGSVTATRLPGGSTLLVLAAAAAVGLALDLRLAGLRLPTTRRQVDERWLRRYRGWVYGAGFGFQLGLGGVTIVPASAVYVTGLCAFLAAGPAAGAAIGTTFGLARGATIVLARRAISPAALLAVDARMERLRRPAATATLIATALAALAALLAAL